MIEHEIAEMAERLLNAVGVAPASHDAKARWVRGFVHGYLGLPYEIDGIRHSRHFFPPVPSADPYRHGFFQGRAERTSRN